MVVLFLSNLQRDFLSSDARNFYEDAPPLLCVLFVAREEHNVHDQFCEICGALVRVDFFLFINFGVSIKVF